MRISRIEASVHRPAVTGEEDRKATYAGTDGPLFVRCRVETEDGLSGNGFTGRFLATETAHFLNHALRETALGEDAGDASLPARLAAKFNPRAMTGVVVSALSAFEIALTDLRAQMRDMSVAELLGGRRTRVPVHVTCGLPHLTTDELEDSARHAVQSGAAGVKIIIAAKGRRWEEDAERLQAVRSAIGPEPDLIADANCKLSYQDAKALADRVRRTKLAWLEEPLADNDAPALARLHAETGCPIGAGQMEQSLNRFRQLATEGAVSVLQPNAVFAGGFGAAAKVIALAQAHGLKTCPAGGWDFLNLHLMAGTTDEGAMEYHEGHEAILTSISGAPQRPENGYLDVPSGSGLGLVIDEASLSGCRIYPHA